MCGIAGIWGNVDMDRLSVMAERLRHRGPDDDGFWISPQRDLGLAHRRLSIIDLTTGKQPIANEDGRVVTVFNGAIYNYRELREDLTNRGHVFKTESDTEVIVHLYEVYGPDFAVELRGMFAIAVWDDLNRQLVLVRDRVGKKPLYYRERDDEFLFASEIKGIAAAARGALTIDQSAIRDYLTWAAVPTPGTIYRDVRAVEPGEVVIVRSRRVTTQRRYWRLRMLPKTPISRGDAIERIDSLVQEAVRLRMRADVPVGCFLSGGIDSGIITAIAARHHPRRLTTATIGFEDDAFDERPLARLVARQYGTDHHELVLRPDVVRDLPKIARAYDQPFGDASAVPSYYVAQAARQHVKVVLSGDGGDEVFAGYRRYVAARINQRLRFMDLRTVVPLWRSMSRLLPVPRRFRSGYGFAHRLVRGLGLDPVSRYLAWTVDGFDEDGLRFLERGPGRGRLEATLLGRDGNTPGPGRFAQASLETHRASGCVDRMLSTDFETVLPFDLLVKMDIATMAHGLEARSPLLDHHLIEEVARFPEHVKLGGFRTKPLLRALAGRYLPASIPRAPKRGFEVPLVRWLRSDLRELSEDVILSRSGLLADLFNRTALETLLREDSGLGPARWSRRVWLLLMLGMWDRHVRREVTSPAGTMTDAPVL